MNIIGKWKISDVMVGVKDHQIIWDTVENAKAAKGQAPETFFYDSIFEFSSDGKSRTLMPIPENVPSEEVKRMADQGTIILYDGMVLAEEVDWKEDNGVFFYDTSSKSALLNEGVPGCLELNFDGEKMQLLTFKLIKIDD